MILAELQISIMCRAAYVHILPRKLFDSQAQILTGNHLLGSRQHHAEPPTLAHLNVLVPEVELAVH